MTAALSAAITVLFVLSGLTQVTLAANLAQVRDAPASQGGHAAAFASLIRNATKNYSTGLSAPWGVAVDTANGYVFVADSNGQNVAVLSGSTGALVSTIKVANGSAQPNALFYDPANGYVYAADGGIGVVSVIDASTLAVIKHIDVGSSSGAFPWGFVYDPVRGDLIVMGNGNTKLTYINTSTSAVTNITYTAGCYVGSWEGVYVAYSHQIFIPDHCTNTITALNASTLNIVANITVGSNPGPIAYDPANGLLYVPSSGSYSLDVINATNDTVVAKYLPNGWFGGYGLGAYAAYDPASKRVYVAIGSHLAVFNPATGLPEGNISLPAAGTGVAYDSRNGELFVADSGLTEVFTTPPPKLQQVSFMASGLAPGLSWSVKLTGGARLYSTSSLVSFSEKRGNYSYTVFPPKNYSAAPGSGTLVVAANNLTVNVTLTPTKFFTVVFRESGLPTGFQWSVSTNGAGTSYGTSGTSSTGTLTLHVPNGLWGYSETVPTGYSVFPTGGSVMVYGSNPPSQQVSVVPELSIGVGSGSDGIAFSASTDRTFVSNVYSSNVSVINDSSNQVMANIPVGTDPQAVLTQPFNGNVYVANSYTNNVSVINASTLKVTATVSVGTSPYFLFYDPIVHEVYVSNSGGTTVTAVWVKNNSVAATITVAGNPEWITEDTSTGRLYVDNAGSCSGGTCHPISVISDSTNTVVATVTSTSAQGTYNFLGGAGIAFDPSNNDVYLLSSYYLYVVSTSNNTLFKTFVLGDSGYGGLLYDPANGDMLVSGHNTSVTAIDSSTNAVAKTIRVAAGPGAMAYVPTAGQIYVAGTGSRSVAVLNASTVALTEAITVCYTPTMFSFDPTHSNLYVGCWTNTVSVVFPPKTFPITGWPVITNVTALTAKTGATITIVGSGFGIGPSERVLSDGSIDTVASSTTPSILVADSGGGSHNWSAGHETATNVDSIGLNLTSWNDSIIIFKGFGTQLGKNWNLSLGDPIQIRVYGPNSGGMAIYEAFVQPTGAGKSPHSELTELHVFGTAPRGAVGLAVPANAAAPTNCTCGTQNLSAFSKQQIVRGASVLSVDSGTLSVTGSRAVLLNFTDNLTAGRVVVYDDLAFNHSLSRYLWAMSIFFFPAVGPALPVSDAFSLIWNSTINGTLLNLSVALKSAAIGYSASVSPQLNTLGTEYFVVAGALAQMRVLLPASVGSDKVGVGAATVIDPLGWTAFGYLFTCSTFKEVATSLVVESATSTLLDSYFTALGAMDPVSAFIELTDYSWLAGRLIGAVVCDHIGR